MSKIGAFIAWIAETLRAITCLFRDLIMKSKLEILMLVFITLFVVPARAVWINEFHYDNDGVDTGELIEIAGPAGTSLAGYSINLYNGSGGSSYGSLSLSGIIPDQQNGYGTLSFAASGMQNGAPDGIALIFGTALSGTVIQFLSYEGAFMAVGGAANGITSVDVGVSEPGNVLGQSLQLVGNGNSYDNFTWAAQQAATAGSPNSGQTFLNPAVTDGGATFAFLGVLAFGLLTLRRFTLGLNQ